MTRDYLSINFKFIISNSNIGNGVIIGSAECGYHSPNPDNYKVETFIDQEHFSECEDRVQFITTFTKGVVDHYMTYGNFESLRKLP